MGHSVRGEQAQHQGDDRGNDGYHDVLTPADIPVGAEGHEKTPQDQRRRHIFRALLTQGGPVVNVVIMGGYAVTEIQQLIDDVGPEQLDHAETEHRKSGDAQDDLSAVADLEQNRNGDGADGAP